MISMLPRLQVLDGIPVAAVDREKALPKVTRAFITSPPDPSTNFALTLRDRETGGPRGFSQKAYDRALHSTAFRPYRYCPFRTRMPVQVPRQFEYHPTIEDLVIYGTPYNTLVVDKLTRGTSQKPVAWSLTSPSLVPETVLGISWLKKCPERCLVGSDSGRIQMFNIGAMGTGRVPSLAGMVATYAPFPRLTCVHGNCTDQLFLASGSATHTTLYDMTTRQVVRSYRDIHDAQINVLRFANNDPNLFATSSFDRTVKYWDLRSQDPSRPIFSQTSLRTLIMVCFSPDDRFLLSSGCDNDVVQWDIARGGSANLAMKLPLLLKDTNWTRSYYLAGGKRIIVGSCSEDAISVLCANTGRLIQQVELHVPGQLDYDHRMYCLSLRGDPLHPSRFSAIVSSSSSMQSLTMVSFDLCQKME